MFNFAALTVALATSATVEMELGAKPIHATAGWSVSGPAPATAGNFPRSFHAALQHLPSLHGVLCLMPMRVAC